MVFEPVGRELASPIWVLSGESLLSATWKAQSHVKRAERAAVAAAGYRPPRANLHPTSAAPLA